MGTTIRRDLGTGGQPRSKGVVLRITDRVVEIREVRGTAQVVGDQLVHVVGETGGPGEGTFQTRVV